MKINMEASFIKFGDPIAGADAGIEKIVLEKCVRITAEAKSLAPKDTGRLANSIQYVTGTARSQSGDESLTQKPGKLDGYVGTAVRYAVYQEFGTKYIPPQPFLRPAISLHGFNKDVQEVKAIMEKEMASKLTKGKKIERFF